MDPGAQNIPNLLHDQSRRRTLIGTAPHTDLAQERIKRFLHPELRVFAGIEQRAERHDEPFEDQERSFCGIGLQGGRGEEGGAFDPGGGELGHGFWGEEEGRGEGCAEVAFYGGEDLGRGEGG